MIVVHCYTCYDDRYDKRILSDDSLASSILTRPRSCRCWLMFHPPSSTQNLPGNRTMINTATKKTCLQQSSSGGAANVGDRLLIGNIPSIPVISVFCRHQAPYIGHYLIKGDSKMTVL